MRKIAQILVLSSLFALSPAWGAQVFLHDMIAKKGISKEESRKAQDELVKAIKDGGKHTLVTDPKEADIFLQPRLTKAPAGFILTIERKQFDKFTGVFSAKAKTEKELDSAAQKTIKDSLEVLSGAEN